MPYCKSVYNIYGITRKIPTSNSLMVNSEYPEEILHNVAFQLGLHCLLRQNRPSEKIMFCLNLQPVTPRYTHWYIPSLLYRENKWLYKGLTIPVRELNICFKNTTCGPSIYTMDHPKFFVPNQKDEFISE